MENVNHGYGTEAEMPENHLRILINYVGAT
jgi:hypothetical protein